MKNIRGNTLGLLSLCLQGKKIIRSKCLGKTQEKRITITAYRAEYERNNARVKSLLGRELKYKKQSRVEPVFGTLIQFPELRKINTKGIQQANKVMHMAAIAYHLKKYMNFDQKLTLIQRKSLELKTMSKTFYYALFLAILRGYLLQISLFVLKNQLCLNRIKITVNV